MSTSEVIERIVYEKDWKIKEQLLLAWVKKQEQSWKRKQVQDKVPVVRKGVKIKVI